MPGRSERIIRRRAIRTSAAHRIEAVPAADLVSHHLASSPESGRAAGVLEELAAARHIDAAVPTPTESEVHSLLAEIGTKFDRQRIDSFVSDLRASTISAIAGPFGLGYVASGFSAFDNQRTTSTTPNYRPGAPGNGTVIVLSAPGEQERLHGHPAAGQTGENLKAFIEAKHQSDPRTFPSPHLKDYRIVNISPEILSSKTGRTEEIKRKIIHHDNLKLRRAEIGAAETVVIVGKRAKWGVDAMNIPAQQIHLKRPSPRSRIFTSDRFFKSDKPTKEERYHDRREQWIASAGASDRANAPTVLRRVTGQGSRALESGGRMTRAYPVITHTH